MGIWSTLHPRQILHASGTLSVHGGLQSATSSEPGFFGQETEWSTAAQEALNVCIYDHRVYDVFI